MYASDICHFKARYPVQQEKVTTNLMPLKQDNYWASRPISPSRNLTIFAFSTRRRAMLLIN